MWVWRSPQWARPRPRGGGGGGAPRRKCARSMYQWLLAVLRALRAAARQAPAAALTLSPEPPRRKKPSPSVLSPVEDPEETPAKRPKTECVSGADKEPEEVSVAAKLPLEAASISQETEERDDFSSDSEDEVVYISSDSAFVVSKEDENTTRPVADGSCSSVVVKMPCDTTFTEETPPSPSKTVSNLSLSEDNEIQAALESPVTPRPPIKEPRPPSPGVSGTRTPLCAAEEDAQQEENKKYRRLLSLLKEKYSGKLTSPDPGRLNKVQTKEPSMTGSPLKEQKSRDASPPVPERTSSKPGDVLSPQLPQRGIVISYYTPPEDSGGWAKQEKRAASVGQRAAEGPQENLFEFYVEPILSKHLFFLDNEPVPCPQKPPDDLAPLTKAMEREISAAFNSGGPEDILSRAFKLSVTREDICTLQPQGWLNDKIMNFYMGLLVERSKKEGYPAVYAFNTFFYSKLRSTSHEGVKKWTKGVDIFQHDVIFVPVHLTIHWTLLVVDLREKAIKYFDSLGQRGDHVCKTVLKYLEDESREKRNIELTASEWTLHTMGVEEIPQQDNGNDCGVFVCKFADFISRDKPIIFSSEHMPYFRKKMVWEIIHQQLL